MKTKLKVSMLSKLAVGFASTVVMRKLINWPSAKVKGRDKS
jgi:hypothetical protein